MRNAGSDVGPNLTGVATRLTREQILESLLEPSARIAAGYGTVGITLKNGKRVDGTLRGRDGHRRRRSSRARRRPSRRIAKTDIAERTNPMSAMPPIGLIVKPRDVRDSGGVSQDVEVVRLKAQGSGLRQNLGPHTRRSCLSPEPWTHPSRSTAVGSILAARRAGSHPASRPIALSMTAAAANVTGSRGSRP